MKLLLDENMPHDLRHDLLPHDVYTVAFMQWDGLKNGKLLAAAAAEQFDALITLDRGIPYQNSNQTLPLSVVVLTGQSDRIADLRLLVPALLKALVGLPPCSAIRVSA